MTHDQIDELPIRRYLLGEAPQEEGERLEKRLLSDADFFELLNLVEDELIDAYARGVLPDRERERFNEHFLSTPERRLKLEILQSLKSSATSEVINVTAAEPVRDHVPWWAALTSPLGLRSPAIVFSLAALLLAVLIGLAWVIYKSERGQDSPLQARAPGEGRPSPESPSPQPSPENAQGGNSNVGPQKPDQSRTPGELNTSPSPANTPPAGNRRGTVPARNTVYAISLSGGLARGGQEAKSFTVPPTTKQVRLSAEFESGDYQKYRVVVRNINTGEQTTRDDLKAREISKGKRVTLTLSPETLKAGDYIMSLTGVTSGGQTDVIRSYYFRITGR